VVPQLVEITPCRTIYGDGGEFGLVLDGEETLFAPDGSPAFYIPGQKVTVLIPAETSPGTHTINTISGRTIGLCDTATFTVLDPTTLVLDPVEGRAPGEIAASGTCPPAVIKIGSVQVSFDGEVVAEGDISGTGEFGPIVFPIPDDADFGPHEVTTNCFATAPFTVLANPGPQGPQGPEGPGPQGPGPQGPGPQGPGPGDPDGSGPLRLSQLTTAPVFPVVSLFAALALLATAGKGLRDRRGRRWVTEHVQAKAGARQALVPIQTPEQQVRAHSVRLRPHQGSGWNTHEEVQDANPGNHPTDDGPGVALR
jgi:hypothetical protein